MLIQNLNKTMVINPNKRFYMKRLSILLMGLIGVLFFLSCEEEEKGPVLDFDEAKAPVLENLMDTTFVLDSATANEEFATFTWSEADYGLNLEKSYTLEMDFAGNNFSNAVELANTNEDSVTFTKGDMNNNLLIMGVAPDQKVSVEFRVNAVLNQYTDTLHSEPLSVSVTPYEVIINYPEIYVPGAYQGWDPPSAPPIFDVNNNNVFEGYILMNVDGDGTAFKFTQERSWDVNWGDNEAGGSQIGDGTLEGQGVGNDIFVSDSGYYKLTADLTALTYKATLTDWSIQGSATGDQLMEMSYDKDNQIWTITADLTAGDFKFISKDSEELVSGNTFDIIYGKDNPIYVKENGEPITIDSDGNYTITLNLSRPPYGYEVIQN